MTEPADKSKIPARKADIKDTKIDESKGFEYNYKILLEFIGQYCDEQPKFNEDLVKNIDEFKNSQYCNAKRFYIMLKSNI